MAQQQANTRAASRICVSITAGAEGEGTVAAALAAAKEAAGTADVLEIRLDALARPEVQPFVSALAGPLLFTNRPAWEGGLFAGSEEARILPLLEAIRLGAAYVDLELKTDFALRQRLLAASRPAATKIIVSWHNFVETPADEVLVRIFNEQCGSGAQIGKIVTMAHDFKDVLRVLQMQLLAAAKGFPLIAFCMGPAGVISRLATIGLGGYMTYAAPDRGLAAAPGQLPVSVLRGLIAQLQGAGGDSRP